MNKKNYSVSLIPFNNNGSCMGHRTLNARKSTIYVMMKQKKNYANEKASKFLLVSLPHYQVLLILKFWHFEKSCTFSGSLNQILLLFLVEYLCKGNQKIIYSSKKKTL